VVCVKDVVSVFRNVPEGERKKYVAIETVVEGGARE